MAAGVLGLHECDDPVCVKIVAEKDVQQHVVSGSQGDAVRHGWDAAAVQAALLGDRPRCGDPGAGGAGGGWCRARDSWTAGSSPWRAVSQRRAGRAKGAAERAP